MIKLSGPFLQQTLKIKEFSDERRALTHIFVFRGSVAIKINDDVGQY
jgi:hypothetical protein